MKYNSEKIKLFKIDNEIEGVLLELVHSLLFTNSAFKTNLLFANNCND